MGKLNAVAQYIPFTTARQQRLFELGLAKLGSKCDALVMLEWQDRQMSIHPAVWNREVNGWELDNGKRVFPRGKGGDPKQFRGIPVVLAHSEEAGVVSTEASIVARAMEEGQVQPVDEEGRPAGEVAADGGEPRAAADYVPDYPVKGLSWDAIEFSLADAAMYDPNPVREEDARQAAEWAELSGKDTGEILKYIAAGAGGVVAIVAFFVFLIWLLNQIGGGGSGAGGISLGMMVAAAPAQHPAIRALIDRVAAAIGSAADAVRGEE